VEKTGGPEEESFNMADPSSLGDRCALNISTYILVLEGKRGFWKADSQADRVHFDGK
jgi:hypothetical protein